MKRLLLLCFVLIIGNYLNGQMITVVNNANINLQPGIDPWNGDLCSFIGDPSSSIFDFNIVEFNAVSVSISSSNVLVVPISNNNLNMSLDFNNNDLVTGGTVAINPQDAGQTTINITAINENWETVNFFLELTVKSCRNNQIIRPRNINPLVLSTTNTFSSNVFTGTVGNVIIPTGSDIEFFGGNSVVLAPGFEVEAGAEFLADIQPCIN